MPSATGCRVPAKPTRLGPRRSWKKAIIRRQTSTSTAALSSAKLASSSTLMTLTATSPAPPGSSWWSLSPAPQRKSDEPQARAVGTVTDRPHPC